MYVCGTYTLPHPHIDAKRGTLAHTVAPGQAGFVLVSYPYLSYLCASHLAGNHGSLPARRAKTKTRKSGNNAAGVAVGATGKRSDHRHTNAEAAHTDEIPGSGLMYCMAAPTSTSDVSRS